jgi:hypothetical protein
MVLKEKETENTYMAVSILGLCFLIASVQGSGTPQIQVNPPTVSSANAEQEILSLSKEKWRWMVERKLDSLAALLHEQAVFVHMGSALDRMPCLIAPQHLEGVALTH